MQSVSEWAPSCIGPYAQAVSANGRVHFAGQIGLDPPTMSLVAGGPEPQAMRCLLTCQAVSIAAKADLQQAMLGCTIYAASADSGTPSKGCPDASRYNFESEMASSASSVTQTFSHVQQMLTAAQQEDTVQPGAADLQPRDPDKLLQTSHPQQQHSSGTEHSGGQCAAQAPSEEGSLLSEGGSEQEEEGYPEQQQQEEDTEGEQEEEEEDVFVDEYLRPREAAASVPQPLLTYVEAEALPKGAAVELQPLAFSASQHDILQGDATLRKYQLAKRLDQAFQGANCMVLTHSRHDRHCGEVWLQWRLIESLRSRNCRHCGGMWLQWRLIESLRSRYCRHCGGMWLQCRLREGLCSRYCRRCGGMWLQCRLIEGLCNACCEQGQATS